MMRVVVTGGAGFLGSHLCDALLARGDTVICIDNLSTGRLANIEHLRGNPAFSYIVADVSIGLPLDRPVDAVAHLASPASPRHYMRHPLETLAAGSRGTENALRFSQNAGARFVLASTSEIYGDPLVHPQTEDNWGHVNPIGPRSVYDEAKRFSEAMTVAYRRTLGVNTGIIRIFNTYGPRLSAMDGRVITNFVTQVLNGEQLTVYGTGEQTRSFCYVDDLIRGIVAMLDSPDPGPLNLGNPQELSIMELAELVCRVTGCRSAIRHEELPQDDPTRRCPQISRAIEILGWQPRIDAEEGIRRTVEWFRAHPDEVRAAATGSHISQHPDPTTR